MKFISFRLDIAEADVVPAFAGLINSCLLAPIPCRPQVSARHRGLHEGHRNCTHSDFVCQSCLWYRVPLSILVFPPSHSSLCSLPAAHIKLESYGSAIEDATKAIELDPTYVKVAALPLRVFSFPPLSFYVCSLCGWASWAFPWLTTSACTASSSLLGTPGVLQAR